MRVELRLAESGRVVGDRLAYEGWVLPSPF
jgi:hypothetical protein